MKLREIVDKSLASGEQRLFFLCPGCKYGHQVISPRWKWNGCMDKPTFSPSILVTMPGYPDERRCHSFVTDGAIRFLPDCHHAMKGLTVELPDFEFDTVEEIEVRLIE